MIPRPRPLADEGEPPRHDPPPRPSVAGPQSVGESVASGRTVFYWHAAEGQKCARCGEPAAWVVQPMRVAARGETTLAAWCRWLPAGDAEHRCSTHREG